MTDATSNAQDNRCRLCGGALTERFTLPVLYKHDVRYLECSDCRSLQTEWPHWLDEAYATSLAATDTGAAQRNLQNVTASYIVARLFGLRNVVDVGGGDGLLCRLLRDYGLNCFLDDAYAAPTYAMAFTEPDFTAPDLVLAFEVLEHFVTPRTDTERLFESRPAVVLASTSLYTHADPAWWFLTPETGQHVFFYSAQALHDLAERFEYGLLLNGGYVVFIERSRCSSVKNSVLRLVLRKSMIKVAGALLRLCPTPGVDADHTQLRIRTSKPP